MKQLFALLILTTLLSCSNEVDIYYQSEYVKNNDVTINGTQKLSDNIQIDDEEEVVAYSFVTVEKGEVNVDVNGEKHVINTKKGGILNLAEEEFVMFSIFYSEDEDLLKNTSAPIMVDSTVYYGNHSVFSEEMAKKYAEESGAKPWDPGKAERLGTYVVNKSDFFAEKAWDLDINDEIPEEIRIYSQDDGNAVGKRTILQPGSFFQIYALISGEYKSYDLREPVEAETELEPVTEEN